MNRLIKEIWDYAKPDGGTEYAEWHSEIDSGERIYLKRFLFSTMDEVRLYNATKYSDAILHYVIDAEEANFFRQSVLKREASNKIEYHRQRDHAAHTLHNYLIGWYIFTNSNIIRDEFEIHTKRRFKNPPQDLEIAPYFFGALWPYVSLLHDIGYFFEGSLEPLDPSIQNANVALGAKIVEDFFKYKFWSGIEIDSLELRNLLRRISNVEIPVIPSDSMAGIGATLRQLGDLDKLREAAKQKLKEKCGDVGLPEIIEKQGRLPTDSFDLWKEHYRSYEQDSMSGRIEKLNSSFQSLIWEGIPGTAVRLLDHGVCSGLILLLYLTFFYRIHTGLDPSEPSDPRKAKLWRWYKNRYGSEDYDPALWWTGFVWATAATAIHNVQQFSLFWPGTDDEIEPLHFSEDPLAYLGILVDIVEEWDRFSVFKSSIISGAIPIQGRDVKISANDNKVEIKYNNRPRATKVKENLDDALCNWDEIIRIVD